MKKLGASGGEVFAGGPSLFGTHAARPAANTVTSGQIYWESDTGGAFISDGTNWNGPINPGAQLDYAQITAPVTSNAISEGAANTLITGNLVAYDGTRVKVKFWAESAAPAANVHAMVVILRDAVVLCDVGITAPTNGQETKTPSIEIFDTPPAGSHTYAAKLWEDGGSAFNVTVAAGAGGTGSGTAPAYLQVTKA